MCQVFFPTLGRKMWLPKALSDEVLPSTLDSMLHIKILDLVCVQCDPQSQDYHRVSLNSYSVTTPCIIHVGELGTQACL